MARALQQGIYGNIRTSTQPVGLTITGNSTFTMNDFVIKRLNIADTVMANGSLIYK